MRFAASRSAPPRWRNWCTRRRPAIRSSPFSSFPRSPKRGCSPSIMAQARWSWDLDRIHAKGYTDNVVDLMVGKLNRLPVETQEALQQLACLGNSAEIATLCDRSRGHRRRRSTRHLWEAVRPELGRAAGGLLQVRPRPRPGSRLFADPGAIARRGPSADRQAARGAHASGEARGGDLRDRQSAQPRRGPDHLTRRTRAAGRAQPDRGQARQGLDGLRLGAHLSHRRRGTAGGGLLGAPARAHLRARVAPGRMRVPDRRAGGRGGALDRAVNPRREHGRASQPSRACAWICTRPSIRATARSPSVSTTSGIWASTGRRIRPKRRRDANTSGSGRSSGAARSRNSSSCR